MYHSCEHLVDGPTSVGPVSRVNRSLRGLGRRAAIGLTSLGMVLGLASAADTVAPRWADSLDTPTSAAPWQPGQRAITSGVASHGKQVVAVGPRGLVLRSDDAAATWQQVAVPVSSDLTSVRFSSATTVWAVGHDAVLLRSTDSGKSWTRVLDGRSVMTLLKTYYGDRAKAGDTVAAAMVREVERSAGQSATDSVWPAPILDLWFTDDKHGFVVGAFGLILRTEDGGSTWTPWMEHTDNERRFHLYGISCQVQPCFVAGEQGLLMRLDESQGRFVKVETPYNGTYFGVHLQDGAVIAHGLRGNVFRSNDGGHQWQKLDIGSDVNVVAALNSEDGKVFLVTQVGEVVTPPDADGNVARVAVPPGGEVLGATLADHHLVLARMNGPDVVPLSTATR